jgi:hypothetical protein
MPAGPEDLLARDLGMPLDDPAEALRLPFSTAERAIDLGEVNGLPFVNRVAVGVEMPATPSRGSRRGSSPPGRKPTGSRAPAVGDQIPTVLVCNNRFELLDDGLGLRDWPGSGTLQVLTFEGAGGQRSFAALRRAEVHERACSRFQLDLPAEVLVDVDGEAHRLTPPLRFRSVSAALRVRAPSIEGHFSGSSAVKGDPAMASVHTG